MTWVRLDDGWADHPKVVRAGPLAALVHVRALCYCSRYLTDGVVPAQAVPLILGDLASLDCETLHAKCAGDPIADLMAAAMWHPRVEGGYRIHDYLDYNPSRQEVTAARRNKKRAGRIGAQVRWAKGRNSEAHDTRLAGAMADRNATAMPPTPSPTRITPSKSPPLCDEDFLAMLRSSPAYRGVDVDRELAKLDVWLASPKGRGKLKTRNRVVAWLNRAEPSLPLNGDHAPARPPSGYRDPRT